MTKGLSSHASRRSIPALALLGALAACHGNDSAGLSPQDNAAAAAISNAIAANSTAATLEGLPVPQPKASALAYDVPPSFVGRWGLTRADCDPDRADTKGLLTIAPDKLSFYESKGRVDRIVRHSPYDVTLQLDMSGEGQSWTSTMRLTLDAASTRLVRTEGDRSYRYQRC
ncbi:MAG TPA: hypothetical protein VFT56_12240 [Sphingomonas sp.]|nr:hypothetical protein [Sphingomonas sp.]